MTKEKGLKRGERVAKQAAFLVVNLAVAKVIIGVLSGSIVLISDAVHSVSDLVAVFTSWFGLKISQRKPDERFPYGYYKMENLATVVVSILILFAFWEIFTEGVAILSTFSSIKIPLFALGISLVDILVLFFFGKNEVKVGKGINSRSLVAMGEENRAHLFSSLAVFVGILSAQFKVPYLEGVMTIAISLLILKIGLLAGKDSIFALMDISPSKEIEGKVAKAIQSVPGIEEFFDLRLRKAGPFIFGETKVGIRKFVDVKRAHEIVDKVEEAVKKKISQIDSFTVHIEPFKTDWQHLVIPVVDKRGLDSRVSERFGRSNYFLFFNLKGKEVKGFYFLENLYKERPVRAGLAAAKLIAEQKSDILVTFELGEISFHALRDHLVDIYQARGKTAKEVINYFIDGNLSQLKKPTKEKN